MKSLSIVFLFLLQFSLYGHELQGLVVDQFGEPVADAYIFNSDQTVHCHSDEDGRFKTTGFEVDDSLFVKHIGHETFAKKLSSEDFNNDFVIVLTTRYVDLTQINVSTSVQSIRELSKVDLIEQPVRSSQEILRKVPGLIIGQHAGGGKAEQLFLRGFDIDHGTDVALSVDGLPVNMVSHAHGQGYADLHFVIPETIDQIDFGKGPYYADYGNFSTAGHVQLKTKRRLEESTVGLEFGSFNMRRMLAMIDAIPDQERKSAYLAAELIQFDGPFDSPQNFNRLNIFGKYNTKLSNRSDLAITLSTFTSDWDASGQIPQRLVDQNIINRFGAVDDTEGGRTSRSNVLAQLQSQLGDRQFLSTTAYYSRYTFDLYSNFTFYLNDPELGDQIRQFEQRNLYGLQTRYYSSWSFSDIAMDFTAGVGFRFDDVRDNQLVRTQSRRLLGFDYANGNVAESAWEGFAETTISKGAFTLIAGLRADAFSFGYTDLLDSFYNYKVDRQTFISPKLSLLYQPNSTMTLFIKSGRGFHSNDSRVVVNRQSDVTLPGAFGTDIGTIWKPSNRLSINAALWYLFLEQEFVYVGDEAIVEPSGRTRRQGFDLGIRWEPVEKLSIFTDINYAYARSIDEEEGSDHIPLAPDWTSVGGISWRSDQGFSGSIQYRFVDDRPANEDNSIIAPGYFITDVSAGYRWDKLYLGLTVENVFDRDWNETQFATLSRLQNESAPVEEIHFTPGTPFFLKLTSQYHF